MINMKKTNILHFEFLVIGSGIAGLNFALEASKFGKVAIVTKKELMESNSNYAQGGIAAVLDKKDSFKKHLEDTLKAGCYLNDKNAVEIMVKEAPKQIKKLIKLGVAFNQLNNKLILTKEGGHSERRIANAKDTTGREIERALIFQVRHNKNIKTFESHLAIDLIVQNQICYGAIVLDKEKNTVDIFYSKAIILATGGSAQVYSRNCNPKIATGDGVAMAARAGAKIQDMEFIQFHPTALNIPGKPTFLISETVRGEGGILKNNKGVAFMNKYHELKDLAPRDIVSRAIFEEMKKNKIYLDLRHKGTEYIKNRFPYLYNELWWFGILMDKDLIPIAPAAHYTCGGVHTNSYGETNIKGLYAFGEVAHTGVHGANRLASNSLLECLVFGSRAVSSATRFVKNLSSIIYHLPTKNSKLKINKTVNPKIKAIKINLQTLMWKNVGIIRETKKLTEALKKLNNYHKNINKILKKGLNKEIIELQNLCQVAILITKAALARKKSIGAHYLLK